MATARKNGVKTDAKPARKTAATTAVRTAPRPMTTSQRAASLPAPSIAPARNGTSNPVRTRPALDITPQAIAEAAYFLWLERGGNEVVNWLEAEAMLKRFAGQR